MSSRNHSAEAKQSFENGSTRSVINERFDLVPYEGVEAIARRLTLGVEKHGARNWESGEEGFAEATLNHLIRHVFLFVSERETEDLDAIICNAAMLCKFRKLGKI